MKKEFIPYEEALAFKELGFDEPCFSVYYNGEYHEHGIQNQFLHEKNECSAPLYQQAFRWFRKKYGYWSYVKEATKGTARFYIEKFDEKFFNSEIYNSYQEAELECLKKLIKIVKNEKT